MTASLLVSATAVTARGTIERACMSSPRSGTPGLCSCIQYVADQTLTRRDQKMGAKFFRDPQMAQDTRQSDRPSHEIFWKKWKNFGTAAEAICQT